MPYINQVRRSELKLPFNDNKPETTGELNYQITSLCNDYLIRRIHNYDNINAVIGALECAKLELYRRLAAPYEDEKLVENGEVYPAY